MRRGHRPRLATPDRGPFQRNIGMLALPWLAEVIHGYETDMRMTQASSGSPASVPVSVGPDRTHGDESTDRDG